METDVPEDGWMPTFYVGQHETRRSLPVTDHVLQRAHDSNYDMITSPITTPHFQSRVLALLSQYLSEAASISDDNLRIATDEAPKIPALSLVDTPLTPGHITSQLLAMVSPWIDLCSPDPLIYSISRQVLYLEVAYAAFCGIEYVFVPSPTLYHGDVQTHGLPQYARAIQEVLSIGTHLQIHIMLPLIDHPEDEKDNEIGSLVPFTREHYVRESEESKVRKADVFGTWDAWNLIRTVCKYNNRLFVALSIPRHLPPLPIQSRWFSEPVRLLSMTQDSFVRNPHGYPVLPNPTQSFISRLMRIKTPPWILLCDVGGIPGLDNPNDILSTSDGYLSPSVMADASPTPAEAAGQQQKGSKKSKDPTPYLSYIRHLQRKQPPRSVVEKYGAGYQDYLQVPLQPLTDNLESLTYEVFEKDPIKYNLYEQAIRKALRDWKDHGKPTSSPSGRVVIAVAGAGRGPLVTRALRASGAEGVEIELWAVEKNPNAYVLLQRHNYEDWQNRVTVVQSDMRSWKGPWRKDASLLYRAVPSDSDSGLSESQNDIEETYHDTTEPASSPPISPPSLPQPGHTPIDILVSELLGSFADNELSPECLDGILHLLNPVHGISIPSSYTAYLSPIAAPKLHADISTRTTWDPTAPDTPSVVWLHAIDYLSLAAPPPSRKVESSKPSSKTKQASTVPLPDSSAISPDASPTPLILPTWTFHHEPHNSPPSLPLSNSHNTRHASLLFRTRDRGVCHGLAGYFEAVLYPGIELSTHPNTMEQKSAGMISWFPIFFPLRTPVYIPDNAMISVDIWRQTDDRKVWYEWMVESWGWNLMIGGEKKKVRLGGGEVMSSFKGGCLM